MSDQSFSFSPGRTLVVRTASGAVSVRAEKREGVIVVRGVAAQRPDGDVEVTGASGGTSAVEVHCPEGTNVSVGTASGAIALAGRLGNVHVTSAAASISVEHAAAADLRTAAGRVEVGHCSGPCRVKTMSGSISIARAGRVDVSTVSGRVRIDAMDGPARVHSVSGNVELCCERAADTQVKTMSAAVTLRLPRGIHPNAVLRALSGKARCDFPPGSDCNLDVRTVSGRIEVLPA